MISCTKVKPHALFKCLLAHFATLLLTYQLLNNHEQIHPNVCVWTTYVLVLSHHHGAFCGCGLWYRVVSHYSEWTDSCGHIKHQQQVCPEIFIKDKSDWTCDKYVFIQWLICIYHAGFCMIFSGIITALSAKDTFGLLVSWTPGKMSMMEEQILSLFC